MGHHHRLQAKGENGWDTLHFCRLPLFPYSYCQGFVPISQLEKCINFPEEACLILSLDTNRGYCKCNSTNKTETVPNSFPSWPTLVYTHGIWPEQCAVDVSWSQGCYLVLSKLAICHSLPSRCFQPLPGSECAHHSRLNSVDISTLRWSLLKFS